MCNSAPLLRVRGLRKSYDGKVFALDGLSFDVRAGERVAIIGPSGAGKSTLLRCINRLVEPSDGTVFFDDREVTALPARGLKPLRSRIGMVFQHHNLIPRTPVLTNVLHGRLGEVPLHRSLFGLYREGETAEAHALLTAVGLRDFAQNRASTLSGGQAQRVGICRALMQQPRLLLADEPVASLDPAAAETVMRCLKEAAEERGVACVVNLHQVNHAMGFATRIIGLRAGQIIYDGPPEGLTEEIIGRVYDSGAERIVARKGTARTENGITEMKKKRGLPKVFAFLTALLLTFLAFRYIHVNPLDVFAGFPGFARFFTANFLPPNVDYVTGNFPIIWARVVDTLLFAVVGTYISAFLAFFLGLLMSREMNGIWVLRGAVRFFVSFLRNVPLLIWATLMIFVFGIGAMVGVMALVLATLGFLARSYADSMDDIAATRLEAMRATGAGWWQVLFHGLVPSFLPAWINWTLFSFEINLRASAVLGMVGAGGLGMLIQTNLDLRGFRRAMSLVLILMALVLATEFLVNAVRRWLAKRGAQGSRAVPPWRKKIAAFAGPLLATAVYFAAAQRLGLNLPQFVSRLRGAGNVLARLWAFNPSALPEIFRQLLVSVAIGVAALAVGALISVVLAFLAAENTSPIRGLGHIIKGLVGLVRAVPSLVLILMVVASLGFGPVAAVVGLVFPCVGYLTRAFISTIEEQEHAVIDAMRATGATRAQIILHGLLPGVFTAFVAWLAIRLEANIADSVSLGIVGAGGVGMLIARAVRRVNFADLTTTVVVIFAAMLVIEAAAQWLRKKIR